MNIWSSINFPIVTCSPTVCYFSREKPLVKPMAPRTLSHIICLRNLFLFAFIFRSINPKNPKLIWCTLFYLWSIYSIYYNFLHHAPISGTVTRKGLTTPLTRRVARISNLCARVVYVVLLGCSTGSITLVSYLRKYLPPFDTSPTYL